MCENCGQPEVPAELELPSLCPFMYRECCCCCCCCCEPIASVSWSDRCKTASLLVLLYCYCSCSLANTENRNLREIACRTILSHTMTQIQS